MFWPLELLWEKPPKILDSYYLTKHTFYHCGKFCGEWPTELGDIVVRKKINVSKT